jgi:type IV pilus assembly protein PilY1
MNKRISARSATSPDTLRGFTPLGGEMRTIKRALFVAAAATVASLPPSLAHAQLDIDPPLPNVLLLVDTSGSMEYLIDSAVVNGEVKNKLPGSVANSSCDAGAPAATVLNRWATLVSVLTGTINDFSCLKTSRQDPQFITDFTFKGTPPYDATAKYYLPFHRLVSGGCTPVAGVAPDKWWEWKDQSIKYKNINTWADCPSWEASGAQSPDGLLDTFRDRIRFGLMTFDSYPDKGTGTAAGDAPDAASGMAGLWSYYPDWINDTGLHATGNPVQCAVTPYEVGSRNQAAPPWEGRLIPFGPHDAVLPDIQLTNAHIQEEIIALRPFGGTPIDGMFADAREFLTHDASLDPNTGKDFGPKNDQFYQQGCRKQFIILLSDGTPNQDLRPHCEPNAPAPAGKCPYPDKAADTALFLSSLPGNKAIQTFVVGFALPPPASLPAGKTCADLDLMVECNPANNPAPELAACCSLNKIANAGGTQHAYFANDILTLKKMLGQILAGISSGSTARTIPVFSTTGFSAGGDPAANPQGDAPAVGYRFVGKFEGDASGQLWRGDLKRERFVCENGTATPQAIAADKGDDFATNINSGAGPLRKFFTYIAPVAGDNKIKSQQSIRPCITANDGLGTYGSTGAACTLAPVQDPLPANYMTPLDGATFAATLKAIPKALGMDAGAGPAACKDSLKVNNVTDCIDKLIKWNVGEPTPPITRDKAACPAGSKCSELGSIYHSTPAVSTPPRELLRDDTYAKFVQDRARRPIVLYTATTDGELHAFKVSATDALDPQRIDKPANNEMWTFIPPYVLPNLLSAYDQQALLLDGPPVVADVVYERKQGQPVTWSTVLVAGSNTPNGFYYALDVTDPTRPRFLWQLSTDTDNRTLFGRNPRSPAIATIALADPVAGGLKEVAVAILPGGYALAKDGSGEDGDNEEEDGDDDWGGSKGKSCSRRVPLAPAPAGYSLMKDAVYQPRLKVRCWQRSAGRSLTIVRLDTGEVLMNFRRSKNEGPESLLNTNPVRARYGKLPAPNNVPFTSPITGVPVPYPGQTGQVANRVYVGDADGQMWRIDVSGTDPLQWRVDLAWDGYSVAPGDPANGGQQIETPPVVSTNALGDTVVLFGTGGQDLVTASDITNRAWSFIEKRNAATKTFDTYGNWFRTYLGGERVTGAMAIFDSVAYFSTYAPAGGGALCSFGESKIWALDYLSGAGRFPVDIANPNAGFKQFEVAANTVIFGVALTKTPSCNDSVNVNDAFFGNHTSVSNVNGGNYQLVWQKGPGGGVAGNPGVKTDASTGIQSMNLQTPRQSTRIDSWASIFE